jgi:CO dehydrogenase nickel-insertion accessory protein CooC1
MDWVLVIVDPTHASLVLARHMKKMAEGVRAGQLTSTRHLDNPALVATANRLIQESPLRRVLFVHNRITDEKSEAFMRQALAADGIEPIGVLREEPSIGQAWLTGSVITDSMCIEEAAAIVQKLEENVAATMTLSWQSSGQGAQRNSALPEARHK